MYELDVSVQGAVFVTVIVLPDLVVEIPTPASNIAEPPELIACPASPEPYLSVHPV